MSGPSLVLMGIGCRRIRSFMTQLAAPVLPCAGLIPNIIQLLLILITLYCSPHYSDDVPHRISLLAILFITSNIGDNPAHLALNPGSWCSGITSALHAEGRGFKPHIVHNFSFAKTYETSALNVNFPPFFSKKFRERVV